MKQIFERIKADHNLIKGLLLGVVAYYILMRLFFRGTCPLVALSGFPCPGCGLTRASIFLLHGKLEQSFRMNPTALLWIFYALLWGINRYMMGEKWNRLCVPVLTGVAIVTLLVYLYRITFMFPGQPPMGYTRNNLFDQLIPGYHELVMNILRSRG